VFSVSEVYITKSAALRPMGARKHVCYAHIATVLQKRTVAIPTHAHPGAVV